MNSESIQDMFLEKIRNTQVLVTLFLMNGFQLKGTIIGYDAVSVLLQTEGKQNLIYKHAISTIQPFGKLILDVPVRK